MFDVWPHRYVFVHSFQDTGELEVVRLLAAHPWVTSHEGEAAVAGGGSALTMALPTARDREEATGVALEKVRKCRQVPQHSNKPQNKPEVDFN